MKSHGYVWFYWSLAFLVPWLALFAAFPEQRRAMWWASVFTTPFGLTEPLFVPEYWNPPSLFDLAQKTGFDIESLIFCFSIGGVCAVLYNILTGAKPLRVTPAERALPLHRHHLLVLATPLVIFAALFSIPWNPIYPGIIAMFSGAAATMYCRPDLKKKTWFGGSLFLIYYAVFLQGLRLTAGGYIANVWNLRALLGIEILGLPVEELLFCRRLRDVLVGRLRAFHMAACRAHRRHKHPHALTLRKHREVRDRGLFVIATLARENEGR